MKVKGHVLSPLSSISQNRQEEETINTVQAVYRGTGRRGDGGGGEGGGWLRELMIRRFEPLV